MFTLRDFSYIKQDRHSYDVKLMKNKQFSFRQNKLRVFMYASKAILKRIQSY